MVKGTCLLKTLKSKTLFMLLLLAPGMLFCYEGRQPQSHREDVKKEIITPESHSDNNPSGNETHHDPSPKVKEEAHAEHKHNHGAHGEEGEGGYKRFINWIGNFHPIAIHFPIALIVMTGISELLFLRFPKSSLKHTSRFMIVAAAITSIPAALLGLAYGYEAIYSGVLSDIFWWHRFCGISTAILAVITASINELNFRKKINKPNLYKAFLLTSIIFVIITGYLGGEMTFGLYNLFP